MTGILTAEELADNIKKRRILICRDCNAIFDPPYADGDSCLCDGVIEEKSLRALLVSAAADVLRIKSVEDRENMERLCIDAALRLRKIADSLSA